MVNNKEGFTIMKDTDKVTLTVSQLKKLIAESKQLNEAAPQKGMTTKEIEATPEYKRAMKDMDELKKMIDKIDAYTDGKASRKFTRQLAKLHDMVGPIALNYVDWHEF